MLTISVPMPCCAVPFDHSRTRRRTPTAASASGGSAAVTTRTGAAIPVRDRAAPARALRPFRKSGAVQARGRAAARRRGRVTRCSGGCRATPGGSRRCVPARAIGRRRLHQPSRADRSRERASSESRRPVLRRAGIMRAAGAVSGCSRPSIRLRNCRHGSAGLRATASRAASPHKLRYARILPSIPCGGDCSCSDRLRCAASAPGRRWRASARAEPHPARVA